MSRILPKWARYAYTRWKRNLAYATSCDWVQRRRLGLTASSTWTKRRCEACRWNDGAQSQLENWLRMCIVARYEGGSTRTAGTITSKVPTFPRRADFYYTESPILDLQTGFEGSSAGAPRDSDRRPPPTATGFSAPWQRLRGHRGGAASPA